MVCFLASSRLTSDTAYPLYRFVKDKILGLIIAHDLNISLAV
jgi:hypothetical protein